jgi:hypothetical protein
MEISTRITNNIGAKNHELWTRNIWIQAAYYSFNKNLQRTNNNRIYLDSNSRYTLCETLSGEKGKCQMLFCDIDRKNIVYKGKFKDVLVLK